MNLQCLVGEKMSWKNKNGCEMMDGHSFRISPLNLEKKREKNLSEQIRNMNSSE